MHATDIEDALSRDDYSAVETAFRALVAFPEGPSIEEAGNVDRLCSLLARVTRALEHDQGTMPAAIVEIISTVLGDPISIAATYATGATMVSAHLYRWRGRYLQHAANGGSIG